MANVTHQQIDEVMRTKPIDLLARIGDVEATTEAARHLDQATEVMHKAVERAEDLEKRARQG